MTQQMADIKEFKMSKRDKDIFKWHIAQKMKERFGYRSWMEYLVNPFEKIIRVKHKIKRIRRSLPNGC